jgi:gp16 family phage-associated protein
MQLFEISQATLEAARNRFRIDGITMSEWAKSRGHSPTLVYAVLTGRSKGFRGAAHKIAKDLGLIPQADAQADAGISVAPRSTSATPVKEVKH